MLELRKLAKQYNAEARALNGVDLIVAEDEIVALIGPSGAGKSTLIRCINRLIEPTSGEIIINGRNISKLSRKQLRQERRKIGMIFQEYALVDRLTVMENVLSGRLGYVGFWQSFRRKFPQDVVEQALTLLDRVGLSDQVDKRADQLSGGQRQRVGIARALVQQPELLLIDEPTASLDPKTARQIMRLIVELVNENHLSAIINIHDVVLAKLFTKRIVGLSEGVVVFDGPSEQLDNTILTKIYGEEDWDAEQDKKEKIAIDTLDAAGDGGDPAAHLEV